MAAHYLGIAEKIHVDLVVDAGVVVLGLKGPNGVRKLRPGDGVIYYSPKTAPDGEVLRSFTAVGTVLGDMEYERDFPSGTKLWVRAVDWHPVVGDVSIYDLLKDLSWIKKPKNWGFYMRGAHRAIPEADFNLISKRLRGDMA